MIPHTSPKMLRVLACLDASVAVVTSPAIIAFSAFMKKKKSFLMNFIPAGKCRTWDCEKVLANKKDSYLAGGQVGEDSQRQTAAQSREDGPWLVRWNLSVSVSSFHRSCHTSSGARLTSSGQCRGWGCNAPCFIPYGLRFLAKSEKLFQEEKPPSCSCGGNDLLAHGMVGVKRKKKKILQFISICHLVMEMCDKFMHRQKCQFYFKKSLATQIYSSASFIFCEWKTSSR